MAGAVALALVHAFQFSMAAVSASMVHSCGGGDGGDGGGGGGGGRGADDDDDVLADAVGAAGAL